MTGKKSAPLFIILFILLATSISAYSHKRYSQINRKAINEYRKIINNPGIWQVLGRTEWNNPVFYTEMGSGTKTTLIIGGVHGDEPAATIAVIKLAQFIKRNPSVLTEKTVLIACANPDGLIRGTRTNSRGVDINRNFPSPTWSAQFVKSYNNPGKEPASEKETALIISAIKKYNPRMIIHMHQPFNTIYANEFVPAELSESMSAITGLPVKEDVWYPTPGSLGSYAVSGKYRLPVITYEMGRIDVEPDYNSVIVSLVTAINSAP